MTFREHVVKRVTRSRGWSKVRLKAIERDTCCTVCSTLKSLEVHHIVPFHIDPSKELLLDNLITLCSRCHLMIGHHYNYKEYNKDVSRDCDSIRFNIYKGADKRSEVC